MALSYQQALAFVHAAQRSAKTQANIEAHMGYGRVPTAKDWESSDADRLDRCEELVAYLDEVCGILGETVRNRPRQRDFFQEGDKAEAEAEELKPRRGRRKRKKALL